MFMMVGAVAIEKNLIRTTMIIVCIVFAKYSTCIVDSAGL